MSNSLFSEFESVSAKQWKQKIQVDLKGANYNDALIWKTLENIDIKPFYHSEDLIDTASNYNTKASEWNVCQTIYVSDASKSNKKAIDVLSRGAESLYFIIPSNNLSIKTLLNQIDSKSIAIYFEIENLNLDLVKEIMSHRLKTNTYILTDIISNLAKTGNWYFNLSEDYKRFHSISNISNSFSINISLYQNAGATIVQQLAYGLSQTNDYLNGLEKDKNYQVVFKVSIGANYFFEIAKLRALRLLWDSLSSEYNITSDCNIIAIPTKRNKTLYDYNTNMLRTTTECMSAILGGVNSISNLSYDAIYHKDNEFGERIARNQLLILKHESYFNKVNNPTDGAYYIEALTTQLAEKALELFKDIELNGGFLKQLKEGVIQRKIKESANKENELFEANKIVLLGTNMHPNPNDKMKDDLELYPFVKTNPRKTLIEPIIEKRLAESIEQERIKSE